MHARAARHAARYTPFILIVLAQALLASLTPSSNDSEAVAASALQPTASASGSLAASAGADPGVQTASTPTTGNTGASAASVGPSTGDAVESAGAAPADPGLGRGRDPSEPGPWPWTHPWTLQGDRSKCAREGRWQDDVLWHSVPCVPAHVGDNGGETSRGVSAEEITIVFYMQYASASDRAIFLALEQSEEQEEQHVAAWAAWFNKHYEYYGRKINMVFFRGTGSDVPSVRNDAQTIVKKHNPFGVIAYVFEDTLSRELARLGVVSTFVGNNQDQSVFKSLRPYAWGYFKNGNHVAASLADYYCAKLHGKNADHAGDADLKLKPRKLGVLSRDAAGYGEALRTFLDAVTGGRCGSSSAEAKPVVFKVSSDPDASDQEQGDAAAAAFRRNGVTTVVGLSAGVGDPLAQSFSGQNYHPEWVMGEWTYDHDVYTRAFVPPDQAPQRFGPGPLWANVSAAEEPFEKIAREMNPNFEFRCSGCQAMWEVFYEMMWGLQWAGPNLTPLTFERGMLDAPQIAGTINANPWPGWECCKPNWPSVGGISANDIGAYTFVQDYRHVYWDPSAISSYDGQPGTYVCPEGPTCPRFRVGQWTPGNAKQPNK